MNCVEVEITSPEEAFEVLFKGKALNLLIHQKLSWEFDLDTQSKHQNINIFSLCNKKNQKQIDDVHYVYFILFHLFKKKKLIMGKVCMRVYMHYFFFLQHKVNLWFFGEFYRIVHCWKINKIF